MKVGARVALLLPLTLSLALPGAAEIPLDTATLGGLRARSIGPATMSGRIAAMAGVATDPVTLWVGSASGGLWKSENAGVTFEPVFDEHTLSIGAVAVDPSDPETVWVGTGESWTRNSTSIGTGLYKSTNGGDDWQLLGLEESERIARLAIRPDDGDVVFVCVTGHLWDASEERGVYRTTDGGESWERVLHVDQDTGCSDIAMDPQSPEVLYAGMWQFRRLPWTFTSGGPGSGLYRSTDGGDTWEELTQGLPQGEKGRIAVAVAPSRPSVVYAVVEADETALYRSPDLGMHWERRNDSMNIAMRPFYFAHVVVDPTDFDRVYKPGFVLTSSSDGGESFSSPFTSGFGGSVHLDHHALWINPENPHQLFLGTDGGVYVSEDRGVRWRMVPGLPVSQFYEVSHDMEWPYNVYGGLQDNGTWMGPSRSAGGIQNRDWEVIGFGDGFHAYVDPTDPDFVFVEYQGGMLMRHRKSTSEIKEIRIFPGEGEEELRFNWNTPIHVSRVTPGTIYAGAQYLFRSRNRGESWERISPDLTTDDPEKQRQEESGGLTIDNSTAENHTTIYTIAESPRRADLLWVGTDDGNLQISRDGGGEWTNVVANVPDLPESTWVSHVEASQHADGRALVTFDGHRTGDMTTHLYRTEDFGETWTSLVTGDTEGYAHVVAEDPVNPDLLFLGTELGLFVTLDGGANWARFEEGFPVRTPVRALAIHPREHDLVIGTHGRGIYILDDLTPLRQLTREVLESEAAAALLPTRPAAMVLSGGLDWFSGDDGFVGSNPPEAATIVYYLPKRHLFGDLKVEIYDQEGELLSTIPGTKRRGLNRVEWPMRLPPPKIAPATALVPAFQGPRVAEGTYRVKLIKGKDAFEGEVTLVPDPRSPHSAEDRVLQHETAMELYGLVEELTFLVDSVIDLQEQLDVRIEAAGEASRLGQRLAEYRQELEDLRAGLVATSEGGFLSGDEKLREQLGALYGAVTGYDGRPTESQVERMEVLAGELEKAQAKLEGLTGERLETVNGQLGRGGLEPVVLLTEEEWERRQDTAGGAGSGARLEPGAAAAAAEALSRLGVTR